MRAPALCTLPQQSLAVARWDALLHLVGWRARRPKQTTAGPLPGEKHGVLCSAGSVRGLAVARCWRRARNSRVEAV